jgi:hypothetical protein
MEDITTVQDSAQEAQHSSSSLVWIVVLIVLGLIAYGASQGVLKTSTVATHQTTSQSQAAPATSGTSIYGSPTLTADQINTILAAYHSPAAGTGQALYDLGVQYGIDPAYALAFFMHESTLGTQGEARATLALGNERCITDRPCIDQDRGGYAQFNSWQDGYEHWYQLLTGPVYKGAGLTTIQTIIPRYAPTADNNNEQAYIDSLMYSVNAWRSGKVVI